MTQEEFEALPKDQQVKELKVQAYDAMAARDYHQQLFQNINQQLAQLLQTQPNTLSGAGLLEEKPE